MARRCRRRLVVRLDDGAPPPAEVTVAGRWVLFDFDFADLNAAAPAAVRALESDLPLITDRDEGPIMPWRLASAQMSSSA
jgi:hypothetical protein